MTHFLVRMTPKDSSRSSVAGAEALGEGKWLVAPDMLVIAANTFGRPCINYSKQGSFTCIPTRISPTKATTHIPLFLAFVNGNHFVVPIITAVTRKDVPYPPIYSLYTGDKKRIWVAWNEYFRASLHLWETKFQLGKNKRVRE